MQTNTYTRMHVEALHKATFRIPHLAFIGCDSASEVRIYKVTEEDMKDVPGGRFQASALLTGSKYTRIWVHMYVHTHTFISNHIYICMYVCTYVRTYVCMYACMSVYIYMYIYR